jgi:hypothetical protein
MKRSIFAIPSRPSATSDGAGGRVSAAPARVSPIVEAGSGMNPIRAAIWLAADSVNQIGCETTRQSVSGSGKSGESRRQQVGRGHTAPRTGRPRKGAVRRSLGKGAAPPLPLHPSPAWGLSRPPCTPRRGTRPGSCDLPQPSADWMRGNGVSRCIDNQGALPPDPPAPDFRVRHHDEKRSASRHLTIRAPVGYAPACAAGPVRLRDE